jgi:hypothetical protein
MLCTPTLQGELFTDLVKDRSRGKFTMIIAENSECYRMITQNDHGDLSGQFAAHWGNVNFAHLRPYESMVLGC